MDGRQYSARELIELINCRGGNGKSCKAKVTGINGLVSGASHPPGQTVSPLLSAEIYLVASPVRWRKD